MRRFRYSVSEAEVTRFVAKNHCVTEFLGRYEKDGLSYGEKAIGLARFFCWLKVVKGLDLSPSQFLDLHLKKRSADSIEERRWALSLAGHARSIVHSRLHLATWSWRRLVLCLSHLSHS